MIPVSVPPAPPEGPERLSWLVSLSEVIALDAAATARTVADTFDLGPADVAPVLESLAEYLCRRVMDAVQLGGDLWEATR